MRNEHSIINLVNLTNEEKEYFELQEQISDLLIVMIGRRIDLKMSQREFAKACGIKQPMIARIERMDATPRIDTLIKMCNAFIIPGGTTFNKTDEYLIKFAIDNDIPLLGICAGMQAICNLNHFDEKVSDQTIKIDTDLLMDHYSNKDECVHSVDIITPFFKDIFKDGRFGVNSRHHYQVKEEDFFIIDARAIDGVVEGIHIPNKTFIVGVEWHPEDLDDIYSKRLFEAFIKSIK